MSEMRKKLHSSGGASFLLALIFFLICAMVGAVVLTAASANLSRIQPQRQEEQAYLTLSSAAHLLQTQLAAAPAFTSAEERWDYACINFDDSQTVRFVGNRCASPENKLSDYDVPAGASQLQQQVYRMARAVFLSKTRHVQPPIQFTPDQVRSLLTISSDDLLEPVQAELIMDENYIITAKLTFPVDGEGKRYSPYALTLTMDPGFSGPSSTDSTATETHAVQRRGGYWPNYTWTTGSMDFPININTLTTTVDWNQGMISKGVQP